MALASVADASPLSSKGRRCRLHSPVWVVGAARAREQLWSPARLPLGGAEATDGGEGAGAAAGGLAGQAPAN